MNIRRNRCILYLIFFLIFFYLCFHPGISQPAQIKPKGYDVIVIIDQSGSMSGHLLGSKAHPKPNDRYGRRTEATHIIISGLMEAAEKAFSGSDIIFYRLSVIEFGTQENLVLDWTKLEYDPAQSDLQRNMIINQIKQRVVNKNLGDTHFISSFELCLDQLRKIRWGSDTGIPRGIVILLMTDGRPYSEDPRYFKNGRFLDPLYSRDLDRLIRNKIINSPDNKASETLFYVVALNDTDPYWVRFGPFWQSLATSTKLIDNNMDNVEFHNEIKAILNQFTFPPSVKVDGSFDCPCYVKKLIITVFEPMPGITATIIRPDGLNIDKTAVPTEEGLTYTKYKIPYPIPGLWKIVSSVKTAVHIDFIYDLVELIKPRKDNRIPPISFIPKWKVFSGEKKLPFRKIQGCPIDAKTIITSPDGLQTIIPLDLTPNGEFIGRNDFTPSIPGKYRIIMRGLSKTSQGKDVEVFSSQELFFEVTDAEPVLVEILKPKKGINLFFGKTTVHLRVRFVSYKDLKVHVSIADVAYDPDQFLKVQIFNDKDEPVSEEICLKAPIGRDPSLSALDNVLEAYIPLKRYYNLFASLLRLGKYKMKFSFNEGELRGDYFIYEVNK